MKALGSKLWEELGSTANSSLLYRRPNWRFLQSPPWRPQWLIVIRSTIWIGDTNRKLWLKFKSSMTKTVGGDSYITFITQEPSPRMANLSANGRFGRAYNNTRHKTCLTDSRWYMVMRNGLLSI